MKKLIVCLIISYLTVQNVLGNEGVNIGKRAESLLGKPRSEYSSVHVINYAIWGEKYHKIHGEPATLLAFTSLGQPVHHHQRAVGDIVLAADGSYGAVLVDSDHMIFSSAKENRVIKVAYSQDYQALRKGFVIRRIFADF
jgi:hypothetical protein